MIGLMELRQIQYFLCLYEEGSVTRAAQRLNIVQPALSMQISKLENELEVKLFERTKKGAIATSEGRRMYSLYHPIIRDLSRAREQMLTTDKELTGHVNIGFISSIAQGVLSNVLQEFVTGHPKVTVTAAEGYSAILSDWVAADMLDAAIINKPRRPMGLQSEHLIDEDLVLVTGKKFKKQLPKHIPLKMLESMDLTLPTRHHGLRSIIDGLASTMDITLTPRIETDSIATILQLVSTTQFVTILPRLTISHRNERNQFKTYPIISPKLIRQVVCVTHPRRPLNSSSAAFINILKKHLQKNFEQG